MWLEAVILLILVVTIALIHFYRKRKVDLTAIISIYVLGFVLIFTIGLSWLSLLIAFFILGNLVTKYGYSVKKDRSINEKVRTISNVWGNGGAALIYAIVYALSGNGLAIIGYLGAVAAATADTFSTEMGQVHSRFPKLIINPWKKVVAGTSGGVSGSGLLASLFGAVVISMIPLFFNMNPLLVLVGTLAGFIGCNIDSLLGATFEAKYRWFNKHVVNLTASFLAGIAAILLGILLGF